MELEDEVVVRLHVSFVRTDRGGLGSSCGVGDEPVAGRGYRVGASRDDDELITDLCQGGFLEALGEGTGSSTPGTVKPVPDDELPPWLVVGATAVLGLTGMGVLVVHRRS